MGRVSLTAQHQLAAVPDPAGLEIPVLQRDPLPPGSGPAAPARPGPEGGRAAPARGLQKDPEAVEVPQGGVEGVDPLHQHQGGGGEGHQGPIRPGMAAVGGETGQALPGTGGPGPGPAPAPSPHFPPAGPGGRGLARRGQEEVVHVDQGAAQLPGGLAGQGGLSRGAGAVQGGQHPPRRPRPEGTGPRTSVPGPSLDWGEAGALEGEDQSGDQHQLEQDAGDGVEDGLGPEDGQAEGGGGGQGDEGPHRPQTIRPPTMAPAREA